MSTNFPFLTVSRSKLRVQLAPSLEHQVSAMIAIMIRFVFPHHSLSLIILFRYNWKKFAVVTSAIAGHDNFVQAVREEVSRMKEKHDIM